MSRTDCTPSFFNEILLFIDLVEYASHVFQDALEYYTSAANRGYLASTAEVAAARVWLADKYGYRLPDLSNADAHMTLRKEPWRIFYGLEPGWLVSLADSAVFKPSGSTEHQEVYKD